MEVTEIGREPGIREECSWLDLEPNEESQDERADYRNNNNPLYNWPLMQRNLWRGLTHIKCAAREKVGSKARIETRKRAIRVSQL